MGIKELKEKLHKKIDDSDEIVLKLLDKFLDNEDIDESIEDSVTIESLLEKSEIEYENGEIESKENVLKEARSKYLLK